MAACGCHPRSQISAPGTPLFGLASYYLEESSRTASGEKYDPTVCTAAHRTLPFGTRVRVTNLENNRSVVVTINDRGPHRADRIIDLSLAAAKKLDMIRSGIVRVRVEVLPE